MGFVSGLLGGGLIWFGEGNRSVRLWAAGVECGPQDWGVVCCHNGERSGLGSVGSKKV